MRFAILSFLALSSFVGAAGCSAADESTAGGQDAITGVTDLTAMEGELGLVKDTQSAAGAWGRSDAKLKAGSCYKNTVGSPDGASFEFRRYTQGAAFFAVRGSGPMTGNKRPVACVDVDGTDGDPSVYSLSGLSLDTAMRFHFGKPLGGDAGLGHIYISFERGEVEIGDGDHYCGDLGDSGERSPGADAYAHAITSCKQGGGSEDSCDESAMTACKKAVTKDVVADTIDRPAFPTIDDSPASYLYNLEVPVGADPNNGTSYLFSGMAVIGYRYAAKVAADRNAFTLTGDPLGKFIKLESVSSNDRSTVTEHARFEHLDVHHTIADEIERLAITRKASDDLVVEKAIVLCTRSVDANGSATAAYQCRGL